MTRPPHVMQLTFGMGIGGMERVIMDLCRYIDPARYRLSVCCTHLRGHLADQLETEGFDVVFCEDQSRRGKYLRALELARLFRERDVQIVHSHNTSAFIDGLIAAKLAGVPVVVHTDHCKKYPIERRWMFAEHVASRLADAVVAVSKHTREDLIHWEKMSPGKVRVIYNGINLRSAGNGSVADLRREFGLSGDEPVVGTVARLEDQKGLDLLLDAVPAIASAVPSVRFLIVGGGSREQDLRAQAARLGIERLVTFTGPRHDAVDILQLFDCFVSTSNFEGMPMALLEAMAAYKPIVATAVGGVPEFIEADRSGVLLSRRAVDDVRDAVVRLLTDPALAKSMGAAGRSRYERHFTAEPMAAAYTALYDECARAKGLLPVHAQRPQEATA